MMGVVVGLWGSQGPGSCGVLLAARGSELRKRERGHHRYKRHHTCFDSWVRQSVGRSDRARILPSGDFRRQRRELPPAQGRTVEGEVFSNGRAIARASQLRVVSRAEGVEMEAWKGEPGKGCPLTGCDEAPPREDAGGSARQTPSHTHSAPS